MTYSLKKILMSLSALTITPTVAMSVVSCGLNQDDSIYRPLPIMPIVKEGFEKANLESIDHEKIFYTDDLISQITEALNLGGYASSSLNIQVFKNETEVPYATTDLFRNATYRFVITNSENSLDKITTSIRITNSVHLQDVFKVTNIGTLYDERPRSVMMGLMFNNVDMISQLTKVGNELTDSSKYVYNGNQTGATIKINDELPTVRPTSYYGSLELTYKVSPFSSDQISGNVTFPVTISEMVALGNNGATTTLDVGRVQAIDKFTILMSFIIENLPNQTYWGLLVNDLDLDNFVSEVVEGEANKYKMKFFSKPYKDEELPTDPADQNGDYDNSAHFLNDETGIELTFSYLG